MKSHATRLLFLVLFVAGCGANGATKFGGAPPSPEATFGSCAFCHASKAVSMLASGVVLKCQLCHDDRFPGQVGPGHRGLPGTEQVPSFAGPAHALGAEKPFGSCAFCHNQFARNMTATSAELTCDVCHDDRLPGTYGPGHRALPGTDIVPSFAGPTHTLGPEAPFGSCAFCHNQFAANITASGVDLTCEVCHQSALAPEFGPGHRSLPGPDRVPSFTGPAHQPGTEVRFGSCAFCHSQIAVRAAAASGHGTLSLDCEGCHSDLQPGAVGPGHRSVPVCAECHTGPVTHQDPAAGTSFECVLCHTPHGSRNLVLIRESLRTSGRTSRNVEVDFMNLLGLADGSFASVTRPGSGLCEVCHTSTAFYRSDGSGAQHFPFACFTCHPHTAAFAPR
ncbi:MAG: hypothetical protein ACE5I7_02815 [Candidatus Binatia bacterium]